MTRIVALALLASAAATGSWTGPFLRDIPGVGMGQYYFTDGWGNTLATQCRAKCQTTVGCQSAQYCQTGSGCYYLYAGQKKNCFLYNSQMDTGAQLTYPASVGAFALWKYSSGGGGNVGTCTGPFYNDIAGVGMAQYKFTDGWQGTLSAQCQAKCHATAGCQAAQFCQSGSSCFYPYGGGAYNCFLYNNQNANQNQLTYNGQGFVVYKCGNGGFTATGGNVMDTGTTGFTTGGGGAGWTGPFLKDIQGVGMAQYHFTDSWWGSGNLASQCKAKCVATVGCQAAQFCQHGDDCFYPYGGSNKNCFLYATQNAYNNQLIHNGKAFVLYKYSGHGGGSTSGGGVFNKWSPALCVDIAGTGLGGTHVNSLVECQQRCVNSYNCVAAQFSQFSTYNGNCNAGWGQSGCNCYIYDSATSFKQVTADIRGFRLYKYNRNGCGSSCCRDMSDKPTGWGHQCKCGSAYGCCHDGVTPKTSWSDWCTCQNRRLSVEDDHTPGVDGVTMV